MGAHHGRSAEALTLVSLTLMHGVICYGSHARIAEAERQFRQRSGLTQAFESSGDRTPIPGLLSTCV